MLGETVTTGAIAFDIKMDHPFDNSGRWFGIYNGAGEMKEIFSAAKDGSEYLVIGSKSLLNGQTFVTEDAFYQPSTHSAEYTTLDARIVFSRATTDDDWTVRVYDLATSSSAPIFDGTIAKTALDGISGSNTSIWKDGTGSDVCRIRKWSAELVQTSEISTSPIESAIVKNSAGETITTLADVTDGEVDCVVNVNQTGGTVFVAIYNSGWKLLKVKSIPVTQLGEQEPIEFTGVDGSVAAHMKLFYWNDDFQPLTGFINPLARQ